MYYDTIRHKAIDEYTLKARGLEDVAPDILRSLGIYPLIHADVTNYNPYTQYFTLRYVPFGNAYMSQPDVYNITDPNALAALLQEFKAQRRVAFMAAFDALEKRSQRPQAVLLGALLAGDNPPEADADLLWQVEVVKQENRKLLAQLEASRTWAEAQAVRPWLPWSPWASRSPQPSLAPCPWQGKEECTCA